MGSENKTPPVRKRRFWRLCRIYFRRFRMLVWLVSLVLLGSVVYLNQIGLPGFIKRPMLEKLRAQGIDLQFSRLRWRFYQGIVAENVTFGKANDTGGPKASATEVLVSLNRQALRHFQLQVDTLRVRHGQIILPVADTNQPGRELAVKDIQTDLVNWRASPPPSRALSSSFPARSATPRPFENGNSALPSVLRPPVFGRRACGILPTHWIRLISLPRRICGSTCAATRAMC